MGSEELKSVEDEDELSLKTQRVMCNHRSLAAVELILTGEMGP